MRVVQRDSSETYLSTCSHHTSGCEVDPDGLEPLEYLVWARHSNFHYAPTTRKFHKEGDRSPPTVKAHDVDCGPAPWDSNRVAGNMSWGHPGVCVQGCPAAPNLGGTPASPSLGLPPHTHTGATMPTPRVAARGKQDDQELSRGPQRCKDVRKR